MDLTLPVPFNLPEAGISQSVEVSCEPVLVAATRVFVGLHLADEPEGVSVVKWGEVPVG